MELCFLKSAALDTLKGSLSRTYEKYFTQRNNAWLTDICGENPFQKFRDVPDFELAPIIRNHEGDTDFNNCKILYRKLHFLTPRQAADERFWAGLCHGVFYDYVRRRHKYDSDKISSDAAKGIKTRFFFEATSRTGILRNTLAKCWWTGKAFFDGTRSNQFEKLDIIGANDISSKISYILRYPFAANPTIINGIVKYFKHFRDNNLKLGELKTNLRPMIYELNKRGGAIVLDCLNADEIAAIMLEHYRKIFPQRFVFDTCPAKIIPIVKVDVSTVKFGDKVIVASLDSGETRPYKISSQFKKKFPEIFDALIGQKINSTVTITEEKFKIMDIT